MAVDALFNTFFGALYTLLLFVAWVAVPVVLFALFWQLRLMNKRSKFLKKIKWELLEIRVPRDNTQTPKFMEQVFAAMYGMYSFSIPWIAKYLEGKVDIWTSFEIVGHAGGINFYARVPSQYRNLLESAVYSQYPGAEIEEAPDYLEDMPTHLPNATFDIFGAGFTLVKNSVYPIRTYIQFEDIKEERRIDPLATIFEAMSKLKEDETILIQLLISPTGPGTGNDMKKNADAEIKKIIEEKGFKRKDKEGNELTSTMLDLSEGYREVVKEMDRKVAKLPFEFTMRFIYVDRKTSFSPLNISAVMGSFQQFNTQNMNAFRPDGSITVFGGWMAKLFPLYKNMMLLGKKRKIWDHYRARRFGASNRTGDEKLAVLNTEELATIYHFPTSVAKAPKLGPTSSRKGEPPVNLPV